MNNRHTGPIPQRPRDVYIKARPVELFAKGSKNEALNNVCSRLQWEHWALEVDPWTIEVARESKLSNRMTIRCLHRAQFDAIWEDEVDRFRVGESTLRDEKIKAICEPRKNSNMVYGLKGWNCQSVATGLAVLICDDPFGAWDNIERLSPFNIFNIGGLSHSLDIIESYYGLRWYEPRLFIRGLRCWMRNYVTEIPTRGNRILSEEEAMNQGIARFNECMAEMYRQYSRYVDN